MGRGTETAMRAWRAAGLAAVARRMARAAGRADRDGASAQVPAPIASDDNIRAAAETDLVELLSRGDSPSATVVRLAREAVDEPERTRVRAFLMRLVDDPACSPLGCLGLGVVLSRTGLHAASLGYLRRAGEQLARTHAAPEFYSALAAEDPDAGLQELGAHLAVHRAELAPDDRLALLAVVARHRRLDMLRPEVAAMASDEAALAGLDGAGRSQIEWYVRMLAPTDPPAEAVDGAFNIAVMDYKVLDRSRTSSNRGDYVQTLAALSHLLRFENVEFAGGGELATYLTDLKDRVHPDRRIGDVSATVVPVPLDRDFASGRSYPPDTWLICNGWFMHRSFGGDVDFPFPDTVNPIMISFHIQDPEVLTPRVVERLAEYAPIGCRDWTTVYRLRDHGIAAFFSGCVTTTVGQLLTPAAPSGESRLADVEGRLRPDAFPGWTRERFTQVGEHVRDFSLVEGLEDARTMLEGYVTFDKVVTSRLHCYLPARSIGLDVHFRPRERADVRFEGLLELSPREFATMRAGVDDKLETVLRAVLTGASRDEVYALWRHITAAEVEAADAYCRDYPTRIEPAIDVDAVVAALRASRARLGDVSSSHAVEVAFALDRNLEHMLPVVLQSLVDHTDRPLRCHVLVRGLGEDFRHRIHAMFPQLQLDFYDFDTVDYGDHVSLLRHISVSTMDRLFLPELLSGLDRVVYLDIDILVQADVGELWDIELGDAAFAARLTRLASWSSLVRLISRASLRLSPAEAWAMRRRLHGVGSLAAPTFNAGVLVINLALMRAEGFTADHLHLVERCRLNDQDVFNVYSRGRVVALSPRWNSVPAQDCEAEPAIIHWAGPAKPWLTTFVLFADRYRATEAAAAARAADFGV